MATVCHLGFRRFKFFTYLSLCRWLLHEPPPRSLSADSETPAPALSSLCQDPLLFVSGQTRQGNSQCNCTAMLNDIYARYTSPNWLDQTVLAHCIGAAIWIFDDSKQSRMENLKSEHIQNKRWFHSAQSYAQSSFALFSGVNWILNTHTHASVWKPISNLTGLTAHTHTHASVWQRISNWTELAVK